MTSKMVRLFFRSRKTKWSAHWNSVDFKLSESSVNITRLELRWLPFVFKISMSTLCRGKSLDGFIFLFVNYLEEVTTLQVRSVRRPLVQQRVVWRRPETADAIGRLIHRIAFCVTDTQPSITSFNGKIIKICIPVRGVRCPSCWLLLKKS